METQTNQLGGMVETVTFQNEETGFAVINISDESGELICVVGPLAGTAPGEELLLEGDYIQHPSYGLQFEAVNCIYKMPEKEDAILKYLSSGVLPGIGPASARNILKAFGSNSLEIIASSPKELASVKGISLKKAEAASEKFLEIFGVREAIATLSQLGFSSAESLATYKHYGPGMLKIVQKNPYCLCSYPLYINFARADAVAESFSYDKGSIQRVEAAMVYILRHNLQNGHTCLPKSKMLETVSGFFSLEPCVCETAFANLCDKGELQSLCYDNKDFVYLSEVFATEMDAAFAFA